MPKQLDNRLMRVENTSILIRSICYQPCYTFTGTCPTCLACSVLPCFHSPLHPAAFCVVGYPCSIIISLSMQKPLTLSGYNLAVLPPYQLEDDVMHRSYNAQNFEKDLNQDLVLSKFKIYPCDIKTQHNHKQCRFYHSNKDRRRPRIPLTSDLCHVAQKFIKDENYDFQCSKGDDCDKCHNKVQQLYCLQKYKTKFCTHYPNDCNNCEYDVFCSFAHREDEIRMELIHHYQPDTDFFIFHYKTLWCPFNYIKHDRSQCYYAHNWQDYRRRPHEYHYEPVSCTNWNPNNFITKYHEECKHHMNCTKCHGWKELEYHPLNYKTRQCSNGNKCPKGRICPYYHTTSEKRKLSDKVKGGYFTYYPRNRRIGQQTQSIEDLRYYFSHTQGGRKNNQQHESELMSESSEGSLNDEKDAGNDEEIESMVKKLIDD